MQLREVLNVPEGVEARIERYSDSAGAYVVLDRQNVSVYKQLYRAAKAKQKLKLRITTDSDLPRGSRGPKPATVEDEAEVSETPKPAVEPKTEQPLISLSPPQSLQDLQEALNRLESTMSLKESTKAMKKQQEKIRDNLDNLEASVNAFGGGLNRASMYGNGCELRRFPTLGSGLFGGQGPLSRCPAASSTCTYAVCCNICDKTIPGAHYHCSTCDDGDFDLCQECVDQGETCKGSDHWLIKRLVKDGTFINSTTERIPPKPKAPQPSRQEPPAPAAPVLQQAERVVPVLQNFLYQNIRTCNSCVTELPESDFVHCNTCDDFDLCKTCFTEDQHGHHPKHEFTPAVSGAVLGPEVSRRLAPGRNETHNAICDGCDKTIRGVRHKCLDCPDWDYCNNCIVDASFVHPEHRFVPIYEQLESIDNLNARAYGRAYHVGICCDGPLCQSRGAPSYIAGVRYKCAVCHDTDFCANCEASPANTHNKTHPLIKFKTPVKYVTVCTTGAQRGQRMPVLGDQPPQLSRASTNSRTTETAAAKEDIVKTEVQTVADVKPDTEVKEKAVETPAAVPAEKPVMAEDLVAVYSRDTVTDGTVLPPNHIFTQTWYLRNEGTVSWPADCAVKFVGGDYMGRVDPRRPADVFELADASMSTVCSQPVAPGEQVPFTVMLRTPAREGKAISYWRLTTKDGLKFGHRLWCDINVQAPKHEAEVIPEAVEEKEVAKEAPAVVDVKDEEPKAESTEESSATTRESQMIFPKLEKESPDASIHNETPADAEAPPAYEEEYEECSNVDDEWAEDDSDTGFLTDEEYDVLDASDEEYLEEQQKKQLKK